MMQANESSNFFDNFNNYDREIVKWVPCYGDMLNNIALSLGAINGGKIVDLGCGNGNLAKLIIDKSPNIHMCLVDSSNELMNECMNKFYSTSNISFIKKDIRDLTFREDNFDFVVSSIAIHHLSEIDKVSLFKKIYKWLKPGGMLCYADIFKSGIDSIDKIHYDLWKTTSFDRGATDSDWDTYMRHEFEFDSPSILGRHLTMLGDVGFVDVYCPWKFSFWTEVIAYKPSDKGYVAIPRTGRG